jgi:hypothetical protein
MVGLCVGEEARPGVSFSDIRWYTAARLVRGDGELLAGAFEPKTNRVILDPVGRRHHGVIMHEILHYLVHPVTHGQGVFAKCDPLDHPED